MSSADTVQDAASATSSDGSAGSLPAPAVTRAPRRVTRVEALAFLAVFVIALVVALALGRAKGFPYDAGVYWTVGETFFKNGHFSLLNFTDGIRGYFPAFVFGEIRIFSEAIGDDGRDVIRVIMPLVFSLISTILLPRLATRVWPSLEFGFFRRVLVGVIVIVFWSGYLQYPLSEFPTLAFALTGLLLAARARKWPWLVVAGISMAAAVQMRPAYEFMLLGLLVLVFFSNAVGAHPWRRRFLAVVATVVGAAALSAPQSIIAHHTYRIWSPIPGAAAKLGTFQLTSGLRVQLYSTFVGGPKPSMNYDDPAGAKLIERKDLGPDGQLKGTSTYVGIGLRHPIGMAGVIGRHVVNGLDQRYADPYPSVLDTGQRRPFRVAGFLLIFVALLRTIARPARRSLGEGASWWPLGVFALGSLTSLPSAVETRFLLPVFLIATLIAVAPGWQTVLSDRPPRVRYGWLAVAIVLGIAFVACMLAVGAATTTHLRLA